MQPRSYKNYYPRSQVSVSHYLFLYLTAQYLIVTHTPGDINAVSWPENVELFMFSFVSVKLFSVRLQRSQDIYKPCKLAKLF